MKVIYDKQTDTLSLILRDDQISESDEFKEGIILDFDKEGKVVSIEILDASKQIQEPFSLNYELKQMQLSV